jgi:hypothetical protein
MHDSLEPFMSFSVMDEHDTDMILNDILDFTSTFDNSDGSKNDYLFGFAPSLEVLPVGTFSEPGDTYAPTSLPQSQPKKPTAITSPEVGEKDTDSSCICLAQVLRLMKQLFPRPSSSFAPSAAKVGDSNAHDPSVSVIIERNRDSIDAIGAILACSCSTDANMLAVTAHIVFKVLGWYAIVARGTSSSRDNGGDIDNSSCGSSSGGYPGNSAGRLTTAASLPYQGADHNSCRMAAQLVLRELYRVQRLVTELAVKLKAMSQDATELLPFSGTILDSLGADLKNKLKILSLEIVQSLRNN